MKKRWPMLLCTLGLLLAAAVAVRLWTADRGLSTYQGKSIRDWALQYYEGPENSRTAAHAAFEAMGTNALPELIRLVETDDPSWRKGVWARRSSLPKVLQQLVVLRVGYPTASRDRAAAARSISIFGSKASSAASPLVATFKTHDGRICKEAADTLGLLGPTALPNLIAAAQSPDAWVRYEAAYALGQMGPVATEAIPVLVRLMHDSQVSQMAGAALYKIGPSSIPSLLQCLGESQTQTRENAILALGNLGSNAVQAAPALQQLAKSEALPLTTRLSAKDALKRIIGE